MFCFPELFEPSSHGLLVRKARLQQLHDVVRPVQLFVPPTDHSHNPTEPLIDQFGVGPRHEHSHLPIVVLGCILLFSVQSWAYFEKLRHNRSHSVDLGENCELRFAAQSHGARQGPRFLLSTDMGLGAVSLVQMTKLTFLPMVLSLGLVFVVFEYVIEASMSPRFLRLKVHRGKMKMGTFRHFIGSVDACILDGLKNIPAGFDCCRMSRWRRFHRSSASAKVHGLVLLKQREILIAEDIKQSRRKNKPTALFETWRRK
jgi:hypothetical protein